MREKMRQLDGVIETVCNSMTCSTLHSCSFVSQVVRALDNDTLLLVMGDHGMTQRGRRSCRFAVLL